jgi:hypothetical protein
MCTGGDDVIVQIADESAGGWGVFCDPNVEMKEGEVVGLTTPRGKSICRVVRVDADDDHLLVGLFRVSDILEEPESQANGKLFTHQLSKSGMSLFLLMAFAVGLGGALGLSQVGLSLFGKSAAATQKSRFALPSDAEHRLVSLSDNLASLDVLKSRQAIKAIGLTDGQQRKIDDILESLVVDLAAIQVDRGDIAPEAGAYMGLLMLRRAWTQVEQTMTEEQLAKWDGILDGLIALDTNVGA